MVLEQNHCFCRPYFDGYFSSSNLELQTEMELELLPSFLLFLVIYLLTFLITSWLTYFIQAPPTTTLSKFSDLKYHKFSLSSNLCYTTWDKRLCHASRKSMSKVKLNNFITRGRKTLFNQRIWQMLLKSIQNVSDIQ